MRVLFRFSCGGLDPVDTGRLRVSLSAMISRGKLAAVCGVIALLALPLGALEPGGTFIDDDGSPHEPNIEALVVAGITNGCADARFCPSDPVDRGQMAAFLDRALELPDAPPAPFTDTAGSFTREIDRLYAAGITTGCGPTTYCPDDVVTRAQMAAFLDRALEPGRRWRHSSPERWVSHRFSSSRVLCHLQGTLQAPDSYPQKLERWTPHSRRRSSEPAHRCRARLRRSWRRLRAAA